MLALGVWPSILRQVIDAVAIVLQGLIERERSCEEGFHGPDTIGKVNLFT